MAEATPYTPETLAAGQAGSWMDLGSLVGGAMFIAIPAGGATFVLEVANDERPARSDATVAESYSATVLKLIEAPMPRFGRIRNTGGSGTVMVSWGKSLNSQGKLVEINPASTHGGS